MSNRPSTAPGSRDTDATRGRVALATSDPVFGMLCEHALGAATTLRFLGAVPPSELLATVRRLAPDLLVLDADGEDLTELKSLAARATLVTSAPIVLVSAYLSPGSQGLSGLLQSIPAKFVQKPRGPSSLSLAAEDGPSFAAAIQAAFAAFDAEDLAAGDLDGGWDVEDERATTSGGDP
jgi:chemotaxis response regulator CheB